MWYRAYKIQPAGGTRAPSEGAESAYQSGDWGGRSSIVPEPRQTEQTFQAFSRLL